MTVRTNLREADRERWTAYARAIVQSPALIVLVQARAKESPDGIADLSGAVASWADDLVFEERVRFESPAIPTRISVPDDGADSGEG